MRVNDKHVYPAIAALGLAGLLIGFSATSSLAHGGGGVGAGMGASMDGHEGMGAGMGAGASVNGNFGGDSATHISTQGSANTNGPDAVDRDTGFAHAQERMSTEGLNHNNAGSHAKTGKDTDSDKDNTSTTTSSSTSTTTPH